MTKNKKKPLGRVLAVLFGFAVATSVLYGGITASYAEQHEHTFSEEWSYGYKNHWHEADCGHGIVKDMAAHTFVDGVCTTCGYTNELLEFGHTHTYQTQWSKNTVYHWHEATCHSVAKDIAKHEFVDGVCITCGYTDPAAGDSGSTDLPAPPKPVELPAEVSAAGGYGESLYAEWNAENVVGVTAYYKLNTGSAWTQIDSNLIRMEGGVARLDAVGLSEGTYSVKICNEGSKDVVVDGITVSAYDRSGYAHFNYSNGVGAYNDDGTLKDGALVIYVTESNKNDVTDFVYKNTANGLVKEDISKYLKSRKPTLNGVDLGGETYGSIGYILNNRGYENSTERENYGIQKLCYTYGAVAVRILGKVTSDYNSDGSPTLTGLTYYAKAAGSTKVFGDTNPITGEAYKSGAAVPNGGTVGDNGQMARITNAKNLTVEGIGENAEIYGWGLHFVSNDNLHKYEGSGTGFEVRNLTFENYPEDAIGMEGTQGKKVDSTGSITSGASDSDADLISPVERCWIHNNTFLPGFCATPAESDKAEGDGSCDFKRGQYYTLAYNYFEYCHKTNLIGSSDNSVTYNVTMHHNWWNNCGSRQPLARQANIHFYNNYISGDSTDSRAELSYVTSFRANCLVFSEANYFDGCKNVTQKKDGEGVAFNNVYYACSGENAYTELTSRTQTISNNCKFVYRNIDYSSFYVNPDVFYYDRTNIVSDCLLDTAVVARVRVMMYAGVNGFGKPIEDTAMNYYTPDKAVSVPEGGFEVDLTQVAKGTSTVSNVLFNNITGISSGVVKGKGQIITFTLTTEAQLTVSASGSSCNAELISSDGKVWANGFTDLTIVLPEGTYVIASGIKDKEINVSKLSFADTLASSVIRIENAEKAINALPAQITLESGEAVTAAQLAYNALTTSEKAAFDTTLKAKLDGAVAVYERAQIDDVIAKINAIGTVTAGSYEAINTAQQAYNSLSASQKQMVTNANVLSAAQSEYAQFAVSNLENAVKSLIDVSTLTSNDVEQVEQAFEEYTNVNSIYDDLDEDQKALVNQTYVAKLTQGLARLHTLKAEIEQAAADNALIDGFVQALGEIDIDNLDGYEYGDLAHIVNLYKELGTLTDRLTAQQKADYKLVADKCEKLLSELPKEIITISATDKISSTSDEFSGDVGLVIIQCTKSNGYSSTNKAGTVTVDGLSFENALISNTNSQGLKFTAGEKAVSIIAYVTTTDSSFAGKGAAVTWTDSDGAHSITTVAAEAAKTAYRIEINLDAGQSCEVSVSSVRLVFFGAVVTAY